MKTSTFTRLLAAAGLATAALCSTSAHAYDSLFVFGDSLSDSGNNALAIGANGGQAITGNTYVPTQPYGLGTYTNAQVWVNSFAAGLGLATSATPSLAGGSNFAFGGARTTVDGGINGFPYSATTQLGGFLAANAVLSSGALFVIAVGGNDVRDTGNAVAADPVNAGSIIGAAAVAYATGVGNMVDALQAKGAANILVWNAPNVGRVPAALSGGPVVSGTATAIANSFNSLLAVRLAGESGVISFDLFGTFDPVFSNPGAFGISNVTDACGAVLGCNPTQYLFWDGIHPTSAGHALLANAMLAAVPEPGSALLMVLGLAGLLVLRRRA